jgi:hypothetical protein
MVNLRKERERVMKDDEWIFIILFFVLCFGFGFPAYVNHKEQQEKEWICGGKKYLHDDLDIKTICNTNNKEGE